MPIEKLRLLFLVKAVIVPPTFLALFLWAVVVTKGGGPLVTGKVELTSSYMNTAYSALTGLNVIIGLFSSMAVNMPVSHWLETSIQRSFLLPLLIPQRILADSPKTGFLAIISSSHYRLLAHWELLRPFLLLRLIAISGENFSGTCRQ